MTKEKIKLSELDLSSETLEEGQEDRDDLYKNRVKRESLRTVGLKDYVGLRRLYGIWILITTLGWITVIGMVVLLQGFQAWNFFLPDSVMMTLLGTTTANVIGLFIIVAKYLFPDNARDLIDPSSISK